MKQVTSNIHSIRYTSEIYSYINPDIWWVVRRKVLFTVEDVIWQNIGSWMSAMRHLWGSKYENEDI